MAQYATISSPVCLKRLLDSDEPALGGLRCRGHDLPGGCSRNNLEHENPEWDLRADVARLKSGVSIIRLTQKGLAPFNRSIRQPFRDSPAASHATTNAELAQESSGTKAWRVLAKVRTPSPP